MYLCLFPTRPNSTVANDEIHQIVVVSAGVEPVFAVVVQAFNLLLLSALVGDWRFAVAIWLGTRIFALWVNMIQTTGPMTGATVIAVTRWRQRDDNR